MSHTLIIGLSGKAGAGKDSAAHALVGRLGFVRIAFADALRLEVAQAWGVWAVMLADRELKEQRTSRMSLQHCADDAFEAWCRREHSLPGDLDLSPRRVMQMWGDWRRGQAPDYWVNQVTGWIRQQIVEGRRRIVVTDCRFLNEAQALTTLGAHIVRIHRPQHAQLAEDTAAHASEGINFDAEYHISNDASLGVLADTVCNLAHSLALDGQQQPITRPEGHNPRSQP